MPRPPSVSISPSVPGVDAANSAVRDSIDSVRAKVRAKNPHATDAQVEAGTKEVLRRRRENQEALIESKARQNRIEEERQLREDSKLRQKIADEKLDKIRADIERKTVRQADKIVGDMPREFHTFSTAMSQGRARGADIDHIVLTPGFLLAK